MDNPSSLHLEAEVRRRLAEARVRDEGLLDLEANRSGPAAADLAHELRVHQIELEMQNDELRRTEQGLFTAQTRYFELYDLAPVSYLVLDEQGLILEANLTTANLLGLLRSALLHQPITRFIFKEDQDLYYRLRNSPFLEGKGEQGELRMTRKDGSLFWAHFTMARARDANGAPAMRLVISDISERICNETLLLQASKMESLGNLAGGVAHDMNNVLAAILGLASANLEIQLPGSAVHHAFEIISQAALRGGVMVKRLLSFARTSPAEMRDVDMNTVLREEISLLQHTTLAKVSLATDLEAALWPIRGDAGALSNALMNLCVNAVDAMPSGGTLTLKTRNLSRDWIEVTVKDTGSGMSKEVLDKALDPFFTTKEVGKGTGLGLPLVYSAVRAHGGSLEIHSKEGEGTRVKLRFPACAPALRPPEPACCAARGLVPASRILLLVDDDELIRASMKTVLTYLGHRVTAASSGEAALAVLDAGLRPDLVILDLNMPGLGGAGTLPRLRSLLPGVPVLLATGRADQTALDLVQAYPGVTLLSKPFSHADLKQHLEALP